MLGIGPDDKRCGALLRRVGDLVLKMAGLIIAAELAQRCLVQLKQNLAQLLGFRIVPVVNLIRLAGSGESGDAAVR
jgi:hypothetical protein